MAYLIKLGHDQPLVDLLPIVPQPRCSGLQYARRSYSGAGELIVEYPYVILEWSVIGSADAYADLLEQFGLDLVPSEDITITLPDELFADQRFNGKCLRPVVGDTLKREGYFIRDVQVIVRGLEVAS